MKNEKLEMKREVWEYFRQYRQVLIKKKYIEMERFRELFKNTQNYKTDFF